jgi:hypothetical protein
VELHGVKRLPLARLKHYLTGHLWISPSHHGDGVNTPGDDEINRDSIQEAVLCLHAPPLDLTALLEKLLENS